MRLSRNLFQGGRGRKQSGQRFFFSFFLLVLTLFYSLQSKLNFSKDPEGSNIFQGRSNFLQGGGGPNANFNRNPSNL